MNSSINKFLVFDVESIGLDGEHWSVGGVLVDRSGLLLEDFHLSCQPVATYADYVWVEKNCPVPQNGFNCRNPDEVLNEFVAVWKRLSKEAWLVADCPYPVETSFLRLAYNKMPPVYPLIDVASVLLATGRDPMVTYDRLPEELPMHDSLADARQSARLLVGALK